MELRELNLDVATERASQRERRLHIRAVRHDGNRRGTMVGFYVSVVVPLELHSGFSWMSHGASLLA
jgi:hypothetical protein